MATFHNTYGSTSMMAAIAVAVTEVEQKHAVDVHTVTLILNGQHGEFDLVIEATDSTMDLCEEHRFEAVAYRSGGVAGLKEVEPR